MPTTPTYAWPYPTPSAPNDVPFDLQKALEAIENTVKGVQAKVDAVPPHLRMANASATSGFGAGVWTTQTWPAAEQLGSAAAMTWNNGTVTINVTGIYVITASWTMTGGTGTAGGRILRTDTTSVLTTSYVPAGNLAGNLAMTRRLTAGTPIAFQVINTAGTAGFPVDGGGSSNNWTVTQLHTS